ncbi:MAG: M3 family metallopeptidase [Leptospirales bacterium]|nr:M3 family metallopeptidase [Leptospirales bacterium]
MPAELELANPLLQRDTLPPFQEIEARHIVPAIRSLLAALEQRLLELEKAPPADAALLDALADIDYEIQRSWGPAGHLLGVMNASELREAYEAVEQEVTAFYLRIGQSRPLFDALERLEAFGDSLDGIRRRALHLRLRDARHAGVGLDGAARQEFNDNARELTRLATEFSNAVLDATRAYRLELVEAQDVDGLPPAALAMAAASWNRSHPGEAPAGPEQGPWQFTLDFPSYMPFMQHATSRSLREAMYRASITRSSAGEFDNTARILRILKLRRRQAQLLGFQSWAELSVDSKMAQNVEEVRQFLEQLLGASRAAGSREYAELNNFAAESGLEGPLRQWDVAYYSERLRESQFQFSDEELRPYFPMPRVLQGLFALAEGLFGVRIEAADGEAPIWHPDVRYFRIRDGGGEALASFYLDPYSRPENKRGGAWMDVCIPRRRRKQDLELPVAYLVCNGTPPIGERPSLMTFREVETLFHEFGHGLQHMLTEVDFPDVSGISGVEWDAVELPSQFMENWCYHLQTLQGISAHIDSGATIPEDLFVRIKGARTFRAASDMLRQLRFALLDLQLHHDWRGGSADELFALQREMEARTSDLPPLDEDRFLCSFSHIFAGGYSAGYYSYKWAEALSADAFEAFEEAGLGNAARVAEVGRRFRHTVLAMGGSRPAMEVFELFRGRKPGIEALLRQSGVAA